MNTPSSLQPRWASALVTLVALGVALAFSGCKEAPPKTKQAQAVKLLPDTPPPPPPPPKPEEKRPQQQKEDKPQPQQQPKPAEVPQNQALKMEGPTGDGPGNGLVGGDVKNDYTGGAIGNAPQAGGPAVPGGNRMAQNAYANAATRALNEYLVREKELKQHDYRLQVQVWLQADGSMQRAELLGSTGQPEVDEALRRALERFPGTRSPLPERMPQPLRLQISNRLMG